MYKNKKSVSKTHDIQISNGGDDLTQKAIARFKVRKQGTDNEVD
jgi:hypothetical protein